MSKKCCKKNNSDASLLEAADFLKIIAEENRLKILCILKRREECVCEIWQYLEIPQNLASHHLKVLKDFGLISSRQEGLKVIYSINKGQVNKYLKLINKIL